MDEKLKELYEQKIKELERHIVYIIILFSLLFAAVISVSIYQERKLNAHLGWHETERIRQILKK